ncbi:MAG: hypothetical protein HRU34_14965 [Richelia sp.]|nr:hypothetical protein [Richelia sp.]CDN15742.1 hypothetical protein RintRC_0013 [Richelia intracellularis]
MLAPKVMICITNKVGVAESGDDFTKFSTISQWFQRLIHPALMQRHKVKLYELFSVKNHFIMIGILVIYIILFLYSGYIV